MVAVLLVAVVAEAAALMGILSVVARLRARVELLAEETSHAAIIAQMGELIDEARVLSSGLARQLTDQARLCDSVLAMTPTGAGTRDVSPGRAAAHAASRAEQSVLAAPAYSGGRAAIAAAPDPAGDERLTRARAGGARAGSTARAGRHAAGAEAPAVEDDMAAARQMGMDPVGVAIQRGLRQRAATA